MGLDTIELLLAVEDAFQIHIGDAEASQIVTVGDLHRAVVGKLAIASARPCLTSIAFSRLRMGIVRTTGTARKVIRPGTSLSELFPLRERRKQWSRLQSEMQLHLPDLRHSKIVELGLLMLGAASTVGPAAYSGARVGSLLLLTLPGLLAGSLLIRSTARFAEEFPEGSVTVGDLARTLLTVNANAIAQEAGGWTEPTVWETLCSVVVKQTGVPRGRITPEARILDDLGIR